eukprot:jgi/Mesvir1/17854/Mv12937-RA.1
MAHGIVLILLGILALTTLPFQTAGTLEMVIVLHRHGSRSTLSKHRLLLFEGGASLTPRGVRQLYDVGAGLNLRYLAPANCSLSGTCLRGLHSELHAGGEGEASHTMWPYPQPDVYIRSSALDRTVASAQALAQGLFTGMPADDVSIGFQPVPVYSIPDKSDYLIRAYDNCPALSDALADYYKSSEFQAQVRQVAPLLASVGNATGQTFAYEDAFNVWDKLNVALELGNDADGVPDKLDASTWALFGDAVQWLEAKKFSWSVAGNLCGGTLLAEVERQILMLDNPDVDNYRLVVFSAHYATMLCFLSALRWTDVATNKPLEKIFPFGAALALEVYNMSSTDDTTGAEDAFARGNWLVRLVYQDGPGQPYQPIRLPCSASGLGAGIGSGDDGSFCRLDAFRRAIEGEAFTDISKWCKACKNVETGQCGINAAVAASKQDTDDCEQKNRFLVGMGILLGILLGFIGGIVICGTRKKKRLGNPQFQTNALHVYQGDINNL